MMHLYNRHIVQHGEFALVQSCLNDNVILLGACPYHIVPVVLHVSFMAGQVVGILLQGPVLLAHICLGL
jgi:hypothetical protein